MFNLNKLFIIKAPSASWTIKREDFAFSAFAAGVSIAYFGSLNPWFMWPLGQFYIIVACVFLGCSFLVSQWSFSSHLFTYKRCFISIAAMFVLRQYMSIVNQENINSFIFDTFHVFAFFAIFSMQPAKLSKLATLLSKIMACLLALSLSFFFLYLLGFPLPNSVAAYSDMYFYTNYYFFLLDDRQFFVLFPRFNSVFLEPGQLGTATSFLLFSQIGKWKKWYNLVLWAALFLTFSLSAYVLIVISIFLSLWIQRKNFLKKLVFVVFIIATITIGSFFYNDGDNLVHDLIILRLEINDGQLAGDNRIASNFQAEYEQFLKSSDIIFGKKLEREWGSAGYKVFFFNFGLTGLFLVFLFFVTTLFNRNNLRASLAAMILGVLNFSVRDFPLWYCYFVPLYCIATNLPINNKPEAT